MGMEKGKKGNVSSVVTERGNATICTARPIAKRREGKWLRAAKSAIDAAGRTRLAKAS
jgi:hypothetical protein